MPKYHDSTKSLLEELWEFINKFRAYKTEAKQRKIRSQKTKDFFTKINKENT